MQSVILGGLFCFFLWFELLRQKGFCQHHQRFKTSTAPDGGGVASHQRRKNRDEIETKIAATRSEKWQNYTFARKSKDMTSKEF